MDRDEENILMLFTSISLSCLSQTQEAQQLLLDWEKLTQFKKILKDMKEGYQIIHKGYTTIRDISSAASVCIRSFGCPYGCQPCCKKI